MFSTYTSPVFAQHIDKSEVSVIFEIGSRDGLDAVQLRDFYSAKVFTFECNPEALEIMRNRLEGKADITIVPKGAWDRNGTLSFFPIVGTHTNGRPDRPNIGASSFFRARDDYRQTYEQTEITVEVVRLSDYCMNADVPFPDLLCMDVQGAALHVLRGLGDQLASVKYVIAELESKPIYQDQDLFPEVDTYLTARGFKRVAEHTCDAWFSDFLYQQ